MGCRGSRPVAEDVLASHPSSDATKVNGDGQDVEDGEEHDAFGGEGAHTSERRVEGGVDRFHAPPHDGVRCRVMSEALRARSEVVSSILSVNGEDVSSSHSSLNHFTLVHVCGWV